jgi:hypothetical protein
MRILDIVLICFAGIILSLMIIKWYRSGIPVPFKFIGGVLLLIILVELASGTVFKNVKNNLFLYHFQNPAEFVLYALFFYSIFHAHILKRIAIVAAPLYLLLALFFSFFIQTVNENNGYQVIMESIVLITFALAYLRELLIYRIEEKVQENPFFWIVSGILFHFSSSLFLEGFLDNLIKIAESSARMYYKPAYLFKYIMCFCYLIAILIVYKTKKK